MTMRRIARATATATLAMSLLLIATMAVVAIPAGVASAVGTVTAEATGTWTLGTASTPACTFVRDYRGQYDGLDPSLPNAIPIQGSVDLSVCGVAVGFSGVVNWFGTMTVTDRTTGTHTFSGGVQFSADPTGALQATTFSGGGASATFLLPTLNCLQLPGLLYPVLTVLGPTVETAVASLFSLLQQLGLFAGCTAGGSGSFAGTISFPT
jgi:hypothetical protein